MFSSSKTDSLFVFLQGALNTLNDYFEFLLYIYFYIKKYNTETFFIPGADGAEIDIIYLSPEMYFKNPSKLKPKKYSFTHF